MDKKTTIFLDNLESFLHQLVNTGVSQMIRQMDLENSFFVGEDGLTGFSVAEDGLSGETVKPSKEDILEALEVAESHHQRLTKEMFSLYKNFVEKNYEVFVDIDFNQLVEAMSARYGDILEEFVKLLNQLEKIAELPQVKALVKEPFIKRLLSLGEKVIEEVQGQVGQAYEVAGL